MFNIIQSVGKCKVVFSIAQRTNKIRFCRENRMKKKQKREGERSGEEEGGRERKGKKEGGSEGEGEERDRARETE